MNHDGLQPDRSKLLSSEKSNDVHALAQPPPVIIVLTTLRWKKEFRTFEWPFLHLSPCCPDEKLPYKTPSGHSVETTPTSAPNSRNLNSPSPPQTRLTRVSKPAGAPKRRGCFIPSVLARFFFSSLVVMVDDGGGFRSLM